METSHSAVLLPAILPYRHCLVKVARLVLAALRWGLIGSPYPCSYLYSLTDHLLPRPFRRLTEFNMGKVHGSLARAGKVKSQAPKVEKQEKKKTPRGRAKKRILYNRR